MPIDAHLYRRVISTRKVGQTDLVFGTRSGFNSVPEHARLPVSVCSGYDLFHPGLHPDRYPDTHTETSIMKSSDSSAKNNTKIFGFLRCPKLNVFRGIK